MANKQNNEESDDWIEIPSSNNKKEDDWEPIAEKTENPVQTVKNFLKSTAEMLGTASDYVTTPFTSATHEAFFPKKDIKDMEPYERIADIGSAFVDPLLEGPKDYPKGEDIAKSMGIPSNQFSDIELKEIEQLKKRISDTSLDPDVRYQAVADLNLLEEKVPLSKTVGDVIDTVASFPGTKLASGMLKTVTKPINKIVNADENAIRAVGLEKKQLEQALSLPKKESERGLKRLTEFAKGNVISAFTNTDKMLNKVHDKISDFGKEIGKIRKKTELAGQNFLSSASKLEQEAYALNGFNKEITPITIKKRLQTLRLPPKTEEDVIVAINKQLDPIFKRGQPRLEQLADYKKHWQHEMNFGKDQADYSVREIANDLLQKEANRAIDFEIKFGEKFLKGKDLSDYKKLTSDYGKYSEIEEGLRDKRASEIRARREGVLKNPLNSPLIETARAKIPKLPENVYGPLITGPQAPGYGKIFIDKYEGYPEGQTEIIPLFNVEKERQKIKMIPDKLEQAKRMNLLNKHGRILIGQ